MTSQQTNTLQILQHASFRGIRKAYLKSLHVRNAFLPQRIYKKCLEATKKAAH